MKHKRPTRSSRHATPSDPAHGDAPDAASGHGGPTVLHLALQGGGAHGAFTWGVLDRLLEEPSIDIGRISGTSAGALNGAALATGLARGGRDAAKEHLALLWNKVAEVGMATTLFMLPWRKPTLGIWDDPLPLVSPFLSNPLGMAPLRYVVEKIADAELLRQAGTSPLYVNAVNVHNGAIRTFGPGDMSIDALLASACAPQMFEPVAIDGQAYWDGSYGANPMLAPLYAGLGSADILLVELTPLRRDDIPMSAKNILNRINEIVGTAGLATEMQRLQEHRRAGADIRTHRMALQDGPLEFLLEPSLKRGADGVLFETLRQDGRARCEAWLAEHRTALGRASTLDIEDVYIRPYRS